MSLRKNFVEITPDLAIMGQRIETALRIFAVAHKLKLNAYRFETTANQNKFMIKFALNTSYDLNMEYDNNQKAIRELLVNNLPELEEIISNLVKGLGVNKPEINISVKDGSITPFISCTIIYEKHSKVLYDKAEYLNILLNQFGANIEDVDLEDSSYKCLYLRLSDEELFIRHKPMLVGICRNLSNYTDLFLNDISKIESVGNLLEGTDFDDEEDVTDEDLDETINGNLRYSGGKDIEVKPITFNKEGQTPKEDSREIKILKNTFKRNGLNVNNIFEESYQLSAKEGFSRLIKFRYKLDASVNKEEEDEIRTIIREILKEAAELIYPSAPLRINLSNKSPSKLDHISAYLYLPNEEEFKNHYKIVREVNEVLESSENNSTSVDPKETIEVQQSINLTEEKDMTRYPRTIKQVEEPTNRLDLSGVKEQLKESWNNPQPTKEEKPKITLNKPAQLETTKAVTEVAKSITQTNEAISIPKVEEDKDNVSYWREGVEVNITFNKEGYQFDIKNGTDALPPMKELFKISGELVQVGELLGVDYSENEALIKNANPETVSKMLIELHEISDAMIRAVSKYSN